MQHTYCIVLGKCPWTPTAQIEGERLHRGGVNGLHSVCLFSLTALSCCQHTWAGWMQKHMKEHPPPPPPQLCKVLPTHGHSIMVHACTCMVQQSGMFSQTYPYRWMGKTCILMNETSHLALHVQAETCGKNQTLFFDHVFVFEAL